MIIALAVLATLAAFCFGVGCYTFFAACSRKKEIQWLDEMAIKNTPYGQFYDHVKAGDQWLKAPRQMGGCGKRTRYYYSGPWVPQLHFDRLWSCF